MVDSRRVVFVAEPWAWYWWPPSLALVTSDPDVDDRREPRHSRRPSVDWQRVVEAVCEAVMRCADAADPTEDVREVRLSFPVDGEDRRVVESWLAGGDSAPRITYLHDTIVERAVGNGRHRLWASKDYLTRPYPLRAGWDHVLRACIDDDPYGTRPSLVESLRAELAWIDAHPRSALAAINGPARRMIAACLVHLHAAASGEPMRDLRTPGSQHPIQEDLVTTQTAEPEQTAPAAYPLTDADKTALATYCNLGRGRRVVALYEGVLVKGHLGEPYPTVEVVWVKRSGAVGALRYRSESAKKFLAEMRRATGQPKKAAA